MLSSLHNSIRGCYDINKWYYIYSNKITNSDDVTFHMTYKKMKHSKASIKQIKFSTDAYTTIIPCKNKIIVAPTKPYLNIQDFILRADTTEFKLLSRRLKRELRTFLKTHKHAYIYTYGHNMHWLHFNIASKKI